MNKTPGSALTVLLWLALMAAGAGDAGAVNVLGSKHDLSRLEARESACVFCHTPPRGSVAPLEWTRPVKPGLYTMYESDRLEMTAASSPQGVSLLCLSCHDGTIAIDSFGGRAGRIFITGPANLGRDLSNDHPISVTYDASRDPENFAPLSTVRQVGLRFYGRHQDQLECGTCHDAHVTGNGDFLRVGNERSGICLTCHLK